MKNIVAAIILIFLSIERIATNQTISFNCGDQNCLICVYDKVELKCLKCEVGFSLINNQCQQSDCNKQIGKFLANQNQTTCSSCHPGCKYCISDQYTDCTECNDGYYAVLTQNNPHLRTCLACKNPDCKRCDEVGDCIECNDGLILSEPNVCSKCSIQFALTCKSSNEVKKCIDGFVKSEDNKSCLPKDTSCSLGEYANNMICTECPKNCLQCDGTGLCYICKDRYYIDSSGQCSNCPTICNTCAFDGSSNTVKCKDCNTGYFLQKALSTDELGICLNILSNLQSCPIGQYVDKETNKCVKCNNNCLECSQFGQTCLKCFDSINYFLQNGHCKPICSASGEYLKYDEDDIDQIKKQYFFNAPIITSETLDNSKCKKGCSISNCSQCIFDNKFCSMCNRNYSLQSDGTCIKICPDGTFSSSLGSFSRCVPCAKGCSQCNSLQNCTACSSSYILKDRACFNDNISTSPIDGYFFFDGHWLSNCPINTITIGKSCIASQTCQNAIYSISAKIAICLQCHKKDEISISDINSPSIELPEIKQPWMGKCYEQCPIAIEKTKQNKFCQNSCDQKQPYLEWTKDTGCTKFCLQNIQNRIKDSCDTSQLCGDGKYVDVAKLAQDGVKLDLDNIAQNACKSCPIGCSKCFIDGKANPICIACSQDYELYLTYSIQDPTKYNNGQKSNFKFLNSQCIKQNIDPTMKCTGKNGYFNDLQQVFNPNTCIMCTQVNSTNGCKLCPENSVMLYKKNNEFDCVPYCNQNQIKSNSGTYCYNKPLINLQTQFNSVITQDNSSFNIPNGANSFFVTSKLSADYEYTIKQITCQLSIPSINNIIFSVSPGIPNIPTGKQIEHKFSLLDTQDVLLKLNNKDSYNLICQFDIIITDIPGEKFAINSSVSVNQLELPNGDLAISSKTIDTATTFTLQINNWSFKAIQNYSQFNYFTYTILVEARNSKNLVVDPKKFLIDTINNENYADKLKLNDKGFQSFSYSFNLNIENPIYNKFNLIVQVQSTNEKLSHLIKKVKTPLDYTYVKPTTPKNTQSEILMKVINSSIFSSGNTKPDIEKIKNLADDVYSYRGNLPASQEIQTNLTYSKQSKLASKYYIPLECDDQKNCSGNGKCKKNNNDWYSMCECKKGYAGEQCNWKVEDRDKAQNMVNVYLDSINDCLRSLDSSGQNTNGLNANQIITLLQLWTDQRDVFKRNSFEKLMQVFNTDTLKKLQNQAYNERLLQVFDNMIDIMRTVKIPESSTDQYYKQISQQIQSTNQQLIKQLDPSLNTTLIIDRSNYKGILIHNEAFNLTLPNSMQVQLPKNMVSDNQYLEVLMKPLDITSVAQQQKKNNKMNKSMISNSLTITVKDITNGSELDVQDILSQTPAVFNITFALPSKYLKSMKNMTCVYWDESEQDWLQNGVSLVEKYYNLKEITSILCKTSHLTEFSVINIDWKNDTIPNEPTIIDPISDSTCKNYIIIYLSCLFSISLIFYVISLFTKNNINTFTLGEQEIGKKTASQILQGILPDFIFGSDNNEDELTDQEVNVRSQTQLPQLESQKISNNESIQKRPFSQKISQVVPISQSKFSSPIPLLKENQDPSPQQLTQMNCQNYSQQNSVYQHQRSHSNSIMSQDQNQQQNANLLSKIQYLNGIPQSPHNNDNTFQKNSNFQNVAKSVNKPYQTNQPSNFSREMKYPTDYQRANNQLVVTNDPTFNYNLDDKNMQYIYKNKKYKTQQIQQNIPTILEESVGTSENQNQNSIQKRRRRANPKSNLISANLQVISHQSQNDNQMNVQDLESRSNANSGEPMINANHLDRNSDPPSNPYIDPLLIDSPPAPVLATYNNMARSEKSIKPYLTLYCWKYSFFNCKSTERVLYCIILMSLFLFSSSLYFQYFNIIKSKDINFKTIISHSAILWVASEIINWAVISFIHVGHALLNAITCNSIKSKSYQIFQQLLQFLFSFVLFFLLSVIIVMNHTDKSIRYFSLWVSTFFICSIFNILLEILLMKLVKKFSITWLFLIIKTKRMDL